MALKFKTYMNYVYSNDILEHLASLWRKDILCDTVITIDNMVVGKAHKLVLFAASSKLQTESKNPASAISLPTGVNPKSVVTCLEYLYEGHLSISDENVHDLLKISRYLNIEAIKDCCEDFRKNVLKETVINIDVEPDTEASARLKNFRTSAILKYRKFDEEAHKRSLEAENSKTPERGKRLRPNESPQQQRQQSPYANRNMQQQGSFNSSTSPNFRQRMPNQNVYNQNPRFSQQQGFSPQSNRMARPRYSVPANRFQNVRGSFSNNPQARFVGNQANANQTRFPQNRNASPQTAFSQQSATNQPNAYTSQSAATSGQQNLRPRQIFRDETTQQSLQLPVQTPVQVDSASTTQLSTQQVSSKNQQPVPISSPVPAASIIQSAHGTPPVPVSQQQEIVQVVSNVNPEVVTELVLPVQTEPYQTPTIGNVVSQAGTSDFSNTEVNFSNMENISELYSTASNVNNPVSSTTVTQTSHSLSRMSCQLAKPSQDVDRKPDISKLNVSIPTSASSSTPTNLVDSKANILSDKSVMCVVQNTYSLQEKGSEDKSPDVLSPLTPPPSNSSTNQANSASSTPSEVTVQPCSVVLQSISKSNTSAKDTDSQMSNTDSENAEKLDDDLSETTSEYDDSNPEGSKFSFSTLEEEENDYLATKAEAGEPGSDLPIFGNSDKSLSDEMEKVNNYASNYSALDLFNKKDPQRVLPKIIKEILVNRGYWQKPPSPKALNDDLKDELFEEVVQFVPQLAAFKTKVLLKLKTAIFNRRQAAKTKKIVKKKMTNS